MTLEEYNRDPWALLNAPEQDIREAAAAYDEMAVGEFVTYLQNLRFLYQVRAGLEASDALVDAACKMVSVFANSLSTERYWAFWRTTEGEVRGGLIEKTPPGMATVWAAVSEAMRELLDGLSDGKVFCCEACGTVKAYRGRVKPRTCGQKCRTALFRSKRNRGLTCNT